ncbi:MAG: glutamate--cysteine ligase [Chromatiaceae bacterium]|nr:glutamate--cysteine ligase [Gammaproteobacteria bacterium]MCP5312999.1 glutamate--cysteine ligase [Chromatiaceae bacterium]
MLNSVHSRLTRLAGEADIRLLHQGRFGLEKESLRVASTGGIALTPHPRTLGSALTHPDITTDYSEALMEFITPPLATVGDALEYLADVQTYVYRHLEDEMLWATSMPCVLAGDQNIPVAQYGASNAGRMKHVYRVGLGYRYGRVMQVIAGVHFNWSFAEDLWPSFRRVEGRLCNLRDFRDQQYMAQIRNLQRFGWLIPYLFGASPAVCKSFFVGKTTNLPSFDESTYYAPHATSLRMGDIGYQNSREEGLGIKACYDDVTSYADSLLKATMTPADAWKAIGVQVGDDYRQLSANILQIENEYYSTVRPKQTLEWMEKPSLALKRRGVRYIELRSLDVNAYHPLGLDETQGRFLEVFLLFCMLADSPLIDPEERREIDRNLLDVAHRGRAPRLKLQHRGVQLPMRAWALEILESMLPVCEVLDDIEGGAWFEDALDDQIAKVRLPDLTPSAKMLEEMRDKGESFYQFARRLSSQHRRYFLARQLAADKLAALDAQVQRSLDEQARLEAEPQVEFDRFLADYFAST